MLSLLRGACACGVTEFDPLGSCESSQPTLSPTRSFFWSINLPLPCLNPSFPHFSSRLRNCPTAHPIQVPVLHQDDPRSDHFFSIFRRRFPAKPARRFASPQPVECLGGYTIRCSFEGWIRLFTLPLRNTSTREMERFGPKGTHTLLLHLSHLTDTHPW